MQQMCVIEYGNAVPRIENPVTCVTIFICTEYDVALNMLVINILGLKSIKWTKDLKDSIENMTLIFTCT